MNEEPEWNWKAVVAGALSNPGIVLSIGIAFSTLTIFRGRAPDDMLGLSDEERRQKRAEMRQKLAESRATPERDPKNLLFKRRVIVGSTALVCACEVLQGYVAGRVAKKHPMEHAVASHLLMFVVGRIMRKAYLRNEFLRETGAFDGKSSFKDRLPWQALSVASVLLGGYLSRRK